MEAAQVLGRAKPLQRPVFDLPDSFARELQFFADLDEGVLVVNSDAETEFDDLLLPWPQDLQKTLGLIAKLRFRHSLRRRSGYPILEKFTER